MEWLQRGAVGRLLRVFCPLFGGFLMGEIYTDVGVSSVFCWCFHRCKFSENTNQQHQKTKNLHRPFSIYTDDRMCCFKIKTRKPNSHYFSGICSLGICKYQRLWLISGPGNASTRLSYSFASNETFSYHVEARIGWVFVDLLSNLTLTSFTIW